jgi:hypothetical protein
MTKDYHFYEAISQYKPSEVRIFFEELIELLGTENKQILKFANKTFRHPEKM